MMRESFPTVLTDRASFGRQVRDALANLYDPASLQTHVLAALVPAAPTARVAGIGRALRQLLIDAIDATRPITTTAGAPPDSVIHQILTLRYVDALEPAMVQERLAIGRSEYYREHQKGVDAVISLLWDRWGPAWRADAIAPSPPLSALHPRTVLEASPRHNLPVQLTSFVGREREVGEVKARLRSTRLLTLTGAGGCGKTRLALKVAEDLVVDYPDGSWFVDLAPLTDPNLIVSTILTIVGVADAPGRSAQVALADFLRGRTVLLLLDNCEHLIDACALLAEFLLQSCPRLRILATSREMLGVAGELPWHTPSLSLPDPVQPGTVAAIERSEAIQLFVQRARQVSPEFTLTVVNAAVLAQICRRLDGIPFAIELAAARTRVLTVEQIATRLDDRFSLLTGGRRTALRRQQTLRALIDWSYDLLSEDERRLMRRLSVFAGGWTLEAAEAVCADEGARFWVLGTGGGKSDGSPGEQGPVEDSVSHSSSPRTQNLEPSTSPPVLDLLTGLVDKSLVLTEETGSTKRYRLLETLRQYAVEKLVESGEAVTVRDRHVGWFLALSDRFAIEVDDNYIESVDWLVSDRDNVRAALSWCQARQSQVSPGLRLAANLGAFWTARWFVGEGLGEGLSWLQAFADLAPAASETLGTALTWISWFARSTGDYARSLTSGEQAEAIFRTLGLADLMIFAEAQIALTLAEVGQYRQAVERFEVSPSLDRYVAGSYTPADRARDFALVLACAGDLVTARKALEKSLTIARGHSYSSGILRALLHLTNLDRTEGDLASARAHFNEFATTWQTFSKGKRFEIPLGIDGQVSAAMLDAAQGDKVGAVRLLRDFLQSHWQRGDSRWSGTILCILGAMAVSAGANEQGVGLIGAGAVAHPRYATVQFLGGRSYIDAHLAKARAVLSDDDFAAAWTNGRAMTLGQAIAFALRDEGSVG